MSSRRHTKQHRLVGDEKDAIESFWSDSAYSLSEALITEMYNMYYRFRRMDEEHASATTLLRRFKKLDLKSEKIYTDLQKANHDFVTFKQEYNWLFFNLNTFINKMNQDSKCAKKSGMVGMVTRGKCLVKEFVNYKPKHTKTNPCSGKSGMEWVTCLAKEVRKIVGHWFSAHREATFRGLVRHALVVLEEHETRFSPHLQKGLDTNQDHLISKGELLTYIRNNM